MQAVAEFRRSGSSLLAQTSMQPLAFCAVAACFKAEGG